MLKTEASEFPKDGVPSLAGEICPLADGRKVLKLLHPPGKWALMVSPKTVA